MIFLTINASTYRETQQYFFVRVKKLPETNSYQIMTENFTDYLIHPLIFSKNYA